MNVRATSVQIQRLSPLVRCPVSSALSTRWCGSARLEFLIRPRDRGTGLFPGLLRTAHADRNLQRGFQQPLHDQARQPAHDRQIRNQRRELRAKLTGDLVRQRRLRRGPAGSTPQPMAAIFRDVRLDRRQLRHLVTPRVADRIARVQTMLAVTTRVGDEIDEGIHALNGDQRPRVSRMARLSARFAPALHAATSVALPPCEAIGGRRLRGRGRVLLPQRQLSFQVGDLFPLCDLLACSAICRSRSASSRRKRSTSCFRRSSASLRCRRLGRDTRHTVRRSDQFVQAPELLRAKRIR